MTKHICANFVTDHAVVRYLERELGFDIEAIRQTIAIETAPAVAMGAEALKKGGLRYILKGGKVVTVVLSANRMEQLKALKTGGCDD